MRINKKMREIRRAQDISQEALAKAVGVSFQTINGIERGRTLRPSDEIMIAIASCLRCNVTDLFSTPLISKVQKEMQKKTAEEAKVSA